MTHRFSPQQPVPLDRYPWWVRVTFFAGGRTRRGQWIYVGLSLIAALVCVAAMLVLDLRERTALLLSVGAIGFVLSAIWYVLSIRWIDRNGSWTDLSR